MGSNGGAGGGMGAEGLAIGKHVHVQVRDVVVQLDIVIAVIIAPRLDRVNNGKHVCFPPDMPIVPVWKLEGMEYLVHCQEAWRHVDHVHPTECLSTLCV